MIREEFERVIRARNCNPSFVDVSADWLDFYPPGMRSRIRRTIIEKAGGDSGPFIADGERTGVGGHIVPTLVRHGTLYSQDMKRHMTPAE
eukprot:10460729-Alexandrium_andersonii.AAC.1